MASLGRRRRIHHGNVKVGKKITNNNFDLITSELTSWAVVGTGTERHETAVDRSLSAGGDTSEGSNCLAVVRAEETVILERYIWKYQYQYQFNKKAQNNTTHNASSLVQPLT